MTPVQTPNLSMVHEFAPASLRPVDLARAAGISASLVRFYEQEGLLPPSPRSASGHRRYTSNHLRYLLVARALRAGYGWVPARTAMQAVHRGDPDTALAVANARHAHLHTESVRLARAVEALDQALPDDSTASPHQQRPVTIGEAARQVGRTPATLRHWELERVIKPQRLSNGRRSYRPADIRRIELVQVLRGAGYSFAAIAQLTSDLKSKNSTETRRALASRQQQLQLQTRTAVIATRKLADLLAI